MLFPGGVVVPFEGLTKEEQLAKTREEIERGTKAIYEATFSYDDVFVKADIIVRNRGFWNLYEVKSSTSVKEHHWDDVAVQYYVLSVCGLPMHKAYLVHINNSYVREGDIVPEELFVLQDITGIVKEKQAAIPEMLAEMREMLRGKVPKIDMGPHCEAPYECDFMDHCWKHVPEHSVFSLRGRGIDQWELYRQGVVRLEDVPLDSLNLMQRMQVEYPLDKKSHADPSKVRLKAADDVGNEAVVSFVDKFTPKPVRTETLKIEDGFLCRVVPEILSHTPELTDKGNLLDNYLQINGDLRKRNAAELDALVAG